MNNLYLILLDSGKSNLNLIIAAKNQTAAIEIATDYIIKTDNFYEVELPIQNNNNYNISKLGTADQDDFVGVIGIPPEYKVSAGPAYII